jgi:hypothetical protein
MSRAVYGINMAKIKKNLRKIECDSRNKMKVAQISFLKKIKLCMQPLMRPIIISYTISEESALDGIALPSQSKIRIFLFLKFILTKETFLYGKGHYP